MFMMRNLLEAIALFVKRETKSKENLLSCDKKNLKSLLLAMREEAAESISSVKRTHSLGIWRRLWVMERWKSFDGKLTKNLISESFN